jgi:ATP-dependent Clp protease ATP-binding subunit ClpA
MSIRVTMTNRLEGGEGHEIKLSTSSLQIIEFADEEARRLKHHYIGTGHLLLGFMRENTFADAFRALGMRVHDARTLVEAVSVRGNTPVMEKRLGLSARAKAVMDSATTKAQVAGACEVKPEHLLEGMFTVDQGIARTILGDIGITEKEISSALRLTKSATVHHPNTETGAQ